MIKIKRAYEAPARQDGTRILVDRVWPRGLRRETLRVNQWMKELAPSHQLRKFFGHDPARWEEFSRRYRKELKAASARAMLRELADLAVKDTVTLVYGAKDEAHNQAVVLREVLERESRRASWS